MGQPLTSLQQRWAELPRQRQRQSLVLGVGALALLAALIGTQALLRQRQEQQRLAALQAPITTVTGLGRLEPVGEVIAVAPPAGSMAGAQVRLRSLQVDEGSPVSAGQLLATMDSLPRLSRAVDEAAAQVAIAETQLRVAQSSSPVGKSNGSPSLAPWSISHRCCWPMNPPRLWTAALAAMS